VATNRKLRNGDLEALLQLPLGSSDYAMLPIYIHPHNLYLYTGNLGVH